MRLARARSHGIAHGMMTMAWIENQNPTSVQTEPWRGLNLHSHSHKETTTFARIHLAAARYLCRYHQGTNMCFAMYRERETIEWTGRLTWHRWFRDPRVD